MQDLEERVRELEAAVVWLAGVGRRGVGTKVYATMPEQLKKAVQEAKLPLPSRDDRFPREEYVRNMDRFFSRSAQQRITEETEPIKKSIKNTTALAVTSTVAGAVGIILAAFALKRDRFR